MSLDGGYGHMVGEDIVPMYWPAGGPVEVTDVIYYLWGATDMGPEVTSLVAGNPEAVFLGLWGEASIGGVMKKLEELNYQGAIFFDVGSLSDEVAKNLGPIMEGTEGVGSWLPDESDEANWAFTQAFIELNGFVPNDYGAVYYTAMKSILLAMEKAGTAEDDTKIADAMYELDFVHPWGAKFFLFPGGQMYVPLTHLARVEGGKVVSAMKVPLELSDYNAPIKWYDAYMAEQ